MDSLNCLLAHFRSVKVWFLTVCTRWIKTLPNFPSSSHPFTEAENHSIYLSMVLEWRAGSSSGTSSFGHLMGGVKVGGVAVYGRSQVWELRTLVKHSEPDGSRKMRVRHSKTQFVFPDILNCFKCFIFSMTLFVLIKATVPEAFVIFQNVLHAGLKNLKIWTKTRKPCVF